MAGVKGRSGRKPLLAESTVEEILKVSSDILLRWLQNPEVPDERKVQVVSPLIAKRIPAKLDGEVSASTNIIILRDGNKTQAVSGQVCVQPEEISGDGQQLGHRQVNVPHLAGHVIQRADCG